MAIYYKFKSARDYDTIAMDSAFISVGSLKEQIYQTKHLGSGKDLDIVISNAQTNEEYLDEEMLIPKNTSVLIRRVPGRPRIRVITQQEPRYEEKVENVQTVTNNLITPDASTAEDEFGDDFYSVFDAPTLHSSNPCPVPAPADEKVDEDTKIKELNDISALDWKQQGAGGYVPGRGYGRGMAGRMGGRGFGMETRTPPPGYVCHRCKVPGHFIQHCSTNGDPNYDVKRPPTGIPKSMLMTTPNGPYYSLPSEAVAVLKPNEDAFEKEMEGLPATTRNTVVELPPELKCPLCKQVMKDAALTSKCCFNSFCDKCIRDHIIEKSMCVCGVDVLADDLLPNKTLRDTINRILESGNTSAENAGSMCQVQNMESARCPPSKAQSPTTSAASKGEKKLPALKPTMEIAEITSAIAEIVKVENPVENTRGSLNGKEAADSHTQPPTEGTPQQVASGEQVKKKKKKPRMPGTDMQWNPMGGADYMMPMGPGPCNQYLNGVQPGFVQPGGFHNGFNGFTGPFGVASMPPYIGYGGPMDMSFMHHPDPFTGQGFGFPPPHRDLANRMMNPPVMGRDEFEARKADLKRKRENEIRSQGGNVFRDGGESNKVAASSSPMKTKSRHAPPLPDSDYDRRRRRDDSPPRSTNRKSERYRERDLVSEHDRRRNRRERHREADRKHRKRSEEQPSSEPAKSDADNNNKSNVFARISFLAEEESSGKQRKTSKSSPAPEVSAAAVVSSVRRQSRREADYDSSDDEDRHFKRKPSRYKRSPSMAAASDAGDANFGHSKRSKGERSGA